MFEKTQIIHLFSYSPPKHSLFKVKQCVSRLIYAHVFVTFASLCESIHVHLQLPFIVILSLVVRL